MHDAFTLDGVEVWTVEDGGRIHHRNSSGVWAYQTTPDEVQDLLRRIYFRPNGTHGWAVGENGAFIGTTNGGATWSHWDPTTVVGSGSEDLWDVHFLDDGSQGWVCGLEMIWHWTSTSDTWAQVELIDDSEPPVSVFERYEEFKLYAIDIVPGETSGTILGLASAEPGLILRSTDDGDVWQVVFDVTCLCPQDPDPCPETPLPSDLQSAPAKRCAERIPRMRRCGTSRSAGARPEASLCASEASIPTAA